MGVFIYLMNALRVFSFGEFRGVYMSMLKLTFILDPAIILAYDHNI